MRFQPPPKYQPTYSPALPYIGAIYGGLKTGMTLYIQGTVHKNGQMFVINLQDGQVGNTAYGLHFNPRLDVAVVMNSKVNRSWGEEERHQETPFTKGEDFQLLFVVTSEGYQIKVNGSDIYLFKHRMPVEDIQAFYIDGHISVHMINIIGGGKGILQGYPGLGHMMSIPYVGSIYGGLKKGMSIHIQGVVPCDATRFHISLQCAEAKCSDKALHINPRFKPVELVAFNTFQDGKFEEQERTTDIPLTQGESFDLVMVVKEQGYQVKINGKEFYTFKHRMPVERVLAVAIGGDVYVGSVNITGGEEGAIQAWPAQGYAGKDSYTRPIHGGLKPGMSLYLRGAIPIYDVNGFFIDLRSGDDTALHFNPQFKHGQMMVNSKVKNEWQSEEEVQGFPFRKGQAFELVFYVTSEGYQVCADGRQIYLFKHLVPPEQVTELVVGGDVSVEAINIIRDQGDEPASPAPEEEEEGHIMEMPAPGDVSGPSGMGAIKDKPASLNIDGGLKPGLSLYFEGTVQGDRFHINLEGGDKKILHFKVSLSGADCLVFNTYNGRWWDKEEKTSEVPFQAGEDFQLVLHVTSEGYETIVNGSNIHTFKHRIPVEEATTLLIGGAVTMRSVNVLKEQRFIKVYPGPGSVTENTLRQDIDLRPGMSLHIQGTLPMEIPDWFNINLEGGEDVVLHFSVRYRRGFVVFNTMEAGWQREERVGGMPFLPQQNFYLIFNVTLTGYQVIINGRVFHLYKHRMPVDQVTMLVIGGDVSVNAIHIIRDSTGGGDESGYSWRFLPVMGTQPVYNPAVPFCRMIPGGLSLEKTIVFCGKVPSGSDWISIDFSVSSTGDRVLHCNPRIGEKSVVRNSRVGGQWGSEEKDLKFNPFHEGQYFEVMIRCGRQMFKVFANGKHMFNYYHRFQPFTKIDTLTIAGDVQLFYILI